MLHYKKHDPSLHYKNDSIIYEAFSGIIIENKSDSKWKRYFTKFLMPSPVAVRVMLSQRGKRLNCYPICRITPTYSTSVAEKGSKRSSWRKYPMAGSLRWTTTDRF